MDRSRKKKSRKKDKYLNCNAPKSNIVFVPQSDVNAETLDEILPNYKNKKIEFSYKNSCDDVNNHKIKKKNSLTRLLELDLCDDIKDAAQRTNSVTPSNTFEMIEKTLNTILMPDMYQSSKKNKRHRKDKFPNNDAPASLSDFILDPNLHSEATTEDLFSPKRKKKHRKRKLYNENSYAITNFIPELINVEPGKVSYTSNKGSLKNMLFDKDMYQEVKDSTENTDTSYSNTYDMLEKTQNSILMPELHNSRVKKGHKKNKLSHCNTHANQNDFTHEPDLHTETVTGDIPSCKKKRKRKRISSDESNHGVANDFISESIENTESEKTTYKNKKKKLENTLCDAYEDIKNGTQNTKPLSHCNTAEMLEETLNSMLVPETPNSKKKKNKSSHCNLLVDQNNFIPVPDLDTETKTEDPFCPKEKKKHGHRKLYNENSDAIRNCIPELINAEPRKVSYTSNGRNLKNMLFDTDVYKDIKDSTENTDTSYSNTSDMLKKAQNSILMTELDSSKEKRGCKKDKLSHCNAHINQNDFTLEPDLHEETLTGDISSCQKKKKHKRTSSNENNHDAANDFISESIENTESEKTPYKNKGKILENALCDVFEDIKDVTKNTKPLSYFNTAKMLEETLNSKLVSKTLDSKKKKDKKNISSHHNSFVDKNSFIPDLNMETITEDLPSCKKKKKLYNENSCEIANNILPKTRKNVTSQKVTKASDHDSIDLEFIPGSGISTANPIVQQKKKKNSEENPLHLVSVVDKNPPLPLDCVPEENMYNPLNFKVRELDFVEEPINFSIPLLHLSEKVAPLTMSEKEHFNSNGIVIKQGKFSKFEDSLIKRNYTEFISRFGINDPYLLLGLGQKYRNRDIVNFLKAKHFYVRLGKDLNNRPLHNIYIRARTVFNPLKEKGKFSESDVSDLKRAHSQLGNKWHEIGNRLDFSGTHCQTAHRWHGTDINKGKWTIEEENNLIQAINNVSSSTDLSEDQLENISWEDVSKLVSTRNFFQCRLYWGEHLSWKMKGEKWTKKHYAKLIYILDKKCFVEDRTRIDWKKIQQYFSDLNPTCMFLQKKLRYLIAQIPPENQINFRNMIEFLTKKYQKFIEQLRDESE